MFIDALTPAEPAYTTAPKQEHSSTPRLGTSSANVDLHMRVHGDGSACPVCQMRVINPTGSLPDPAGVLDAQLAATSTVLGKARRRR